MYLLKLGNFIGFCHTKVESFFFLRPAWDVEVKNKKHFNKWNKKKMESNGKFQPKLQEGSGQAML